jgi:hypothetical protein
MRSLAIAVALTGAWLTTAAAADEDVMTAGDLQQLCAGTDHVSVNVCRVYILGVTEGLALGMNIADGRTKGGRPCVPRGMSGDKLEATVKKKLDALASAADRNADASQLIGAELTSAFPCGNADQ